MKLTERQRYWLEHIQASEASGKGATAYAAEQGLARFSCWGDVRWQEDVGEERRVARGAAKTLSTCANGGGNERSEVEHPVIKRCLGEFFRRGRCRIVVHCT